MNSQAVKMIARELFLEVIGESVRIIAQSGVDACRKVMSCAEYVVDDISASVTADLARYCHFVWFWVQLSVCNNSDNNHHNEMLFYST